MQIEERLGIDEDADVAELKDAIALRRPVLETNDITQSGTAPALHAQTQATFGGRDVLLLQRCANASQRLFGDVDALRHRRRSCGRVLDVNCAHNHLVLRSRSRYLAS